MKFQIISTKKNKKQELLANFRCQRFSRIPLYAATKTKYRNWLNAENNLILQVTSIELLFEYFLNTKQQIHPSH